MPDVRFVISTTKNVPRLLKSHVTSGASQQLLDVVEHMEQHGLMSEATFTWKAVELAVETHLACAALWRHLQHV